MESLERLQRKFRSIQSRVRESKNQKQLYGAGENVKRRYKYKADVSRVEKKVSELDTMLSMMEDMPRRFEISAGELSRRRGLLTRLKNDVVEVSNILARGRERVDRNDFQFTPQVEESLETRHMSNEQLMQRQQHEELKQEQHLDDILRGVSTLKDIGYEINNELTFQGELLDGLEEGVDKTGQNISRNTHRVATISRESTSCWPMFIMIFLLFVIVFLLIW